LNGEKIGNQAIRFIEHFNYNLRT